MMPPHSPVRQERESVSAGTISRIAIGVLLAAAATIAIARYLLGVEVASIRTGLAPSPSRASAQIGIVEQTPAALGDQVGDPRAKAEYALHHYAWVDRSRGEVRIPIERAIGLYVGLQDTDGGLGRE